MDMLLRRDCAFTFFTNDCSYVINASIPCMKHFLADNYLTTISNEFMRQMMFNIKNYCIVILDANHALIA